MFYNVHVFILCNVCLRINLNFVILYIPRQVVRVNKNLENLEILKFSGSRFGGGRVFPLTIGTDPKFVSARATSRESTLRDRDLGKYDKKKDFLRRKINQSKYLHSGRFLYISGRLGGHPPFLDTPGNSGRLGMSV